MQDSDLLLRLPTVFAAFKQLSQADSASDTQQHRLIRLFDRPRGFHNALNPGKLETLLHEYSRLAGKLRLQGDFIDIWDIARLERGELRHAAVLAWLFDANGSHGRGERIFCKFLQRLGTPERLEIAVPHSGGYSIATERYPLGNSESRVDIVVDGPDFLVFIEVKIDAPEDDDQIERYLTLARDKARVAAKKSYYVIFLSTTRSQKCADNFAAATWIDVAKAINETANCSGDFGDRILRQFARHVSRL